MKTARSLAPPPKEGEAAPIDLTRLLLAWRRGSADALETLVPAIYADLHRLAMSHLRGERAAHTLQATALINEAFVRLMARQPPDWQDREHFFAVAATLMRRILIDYARHRGRAKRDRTRTIRLALDPTLDEGASAVDQLCLSQALDELRALDPSAARVVELRYYLGLTVTEAALALGMSERSIKRRWQAARLWLRSNLEQARPEDPRPAGHRWS